MSLSARGTEGALHLYARYPQAFGVIDRAKGLLLAGLAGQAVSTAQAHDVETRRLDNLQGALLTRAVIGQAQGILIERERVTADQPSTSCAEPPSTSTSSSGTSPRTW